MRIKNFQEKVEIPSEINLAVDGCKVTLKKGSSEVSKTFKMPRLKFAKEGNSVVISCIQYNIYDKKDVNTVIAHLHNMIAGVKDGFMYTLKICASHFPMTVTVSGNKLAVKNLLGEKYPRELIIKKGAAVAVKADIIEVKGADLECVSQVAADIEKLTRITNRDRRIFQDGIYITNKAGKAV